MEISVLLIIIVVGFLFSIDIYTIWHILAYKDVFPIYSTSYPK